MRLNESLKYTDKANDVKTFINIRDEFVDILIESNSKKEYLHNFYRLCKYLECNHKYWYNTTYEENIKHHLNLVIYELKNIIHWTSVYNKLISFFGFKHDETYNLYISYINYYIDIQCLYGFEKHCIAMTNKNIRCTNMNSHNEYCLSHNTRNTQYIKILNNHVILDISTIIIGYL